MKSRLTAPAAHNYITNTTRGPQAADYNAQEDHNHHHQQQQHLMISQLLMGRKASNSFCGGSQTNMSIIIIIIIIFECSAFSIVMEERERAGEPLSIGQCIAVVLGMTWRYSNSSMFRKQITVAVVWSTKITIKKHYFILYLNVALYLSPSLARSFASKTGKGDRFIRRGYLFIVSNFYY